MNLTRRSLLKSIAAAPLVQGAAQKKPNVLVIVCDEWRAQATGYNGDPNVRTPVLARLRRRLADRRRLPVYGGTGESAGSVSALPFARATALSILNSASAVEGTLCESANSLAAQCTLRRERASERDSAWLLRSYGGN